VATLNGRTCPVCGADDHRFFPVDKEKPRLPRHVPATREFGQQDKVERPATKHEARKVRHRDGSASTRYRPIERRKTTENYNQWLNRQLKEDLAFVRSILGKACFELFESGKITLEKMTVDGRIKRLSELA